MVALFNGVGGGAAALVALLELHEFTSLPAVCDRPNVLCEIDVPWFTLAATAFTILVGSVSFAGSIVTFAKLQELMTSRPVVFPGLPIVFAASGIAAIVLGVLTVTSPAMWIGIDARAARPGRRPAAGAAGRRRRRTDRDLAAQRVHRPHGRGERLRARQRRAARRRHAGRRVRHLPDDADGQGHGPLGHQHPLRRAQGRLDARRRRGLRPAGEVGRARGRRDPARVRRPRDHRPRLRPGRRPGAAHAARAGRRAHRARRRRSTTRSTRSPAGCPAT